MRWAASVLVLHPDRGQRDPRLALELSERRLEDEGRLVVAHAHLLLGDREEALRVIQVDELDDPTSPRIFLALHALLRAWADVWLGQVHASWDIRPALETIDCPVLAVQGSEDEFGSAEPLRVIERRVPGATAWNVDGAGHTPFSDQAAFVEQIAAFWAQT